MRDPSTPRAAWLGKRAPAGIQYAGRPGISRACKDAVARILQGGELITRCRILTAGRKHALLLTVSRDGLVGVKSGFASGYGGEGPTAFAYVLQLLDKYDVEIDEIEVTAGLIQRLDRSALTNDDVEKIEAAREITPTRWFDYIIGKHWDGQELGSLWREFPAVMPFAIIDSRIADLATAFENRPDECLLKGYRRLEDIVRTRAKLDEHGAKLFSQAFLAEPPVLEWVGLPRAEQVGRANLFTAAYSAHRNPRAHRELADFPSSQLTEFLVLNHLYLLEARASVAAFQGQKAKKPKTSVTVTQRTPEPADAKRG